MLRCAVSIDIDEVHHYYRIHGLPAPQGGAAHAAYDVAFERCLEFFGDLGVPLTFFVVAADLRRVPNAEWVRSAVKLGHEIGSHSLDHLYDLSRRPASEQRIQIEGAQQLFQEYLGFRPEGFRAPGYVVDNELLARVAEAGHRYDSSVFPSLPYYAAKIGAIARHRLSGRRSNAIVQGPSVLSAPTRPYRVGNPYTEPGTGIWELPVQVTPGLRLPYIGTALTMAGELGASALTRMVLGEPSVNLELHAIDLLERNDGLTLLAGYQPDLRVGIDGKRRVFRSVIRRLRAAGYRFTRLTEFCVDS